MTVGGWQSRTTVEDMDLSLRTYVNGWKAIYLADTTCLNEVRPLDRLLGVQAGQTIPVAHQLRTFWEFCGLDWRSYVCSFRRGGSFCWCGLPGTAVSRLHAQHARPAGKA